MASQFDPNAFLNATVTEANSTEMTPVPEGEYLAIADKVTVVPWSKKDGSDSGLKLQIIWDIQDENVKALLERSKITVRQDQMLDLTDTGQLALGKGQNVGLGRLRDGLGDRLRQAAEQQGETRPRLPHLGDARRPEAHRGTALRPVAGRRREEDRRLIDRPPGTLTRLASAHSLAQ